MPLFQKFLKPEVEPDRAYGHLAQTLLAHKESNFVVALGLGSDLGTLQALMDSRFNVSRRDVLPALEQMFILFNTDFRLLFPQAPTPFPKPRKEGKVKCNSEKCPYAAIVEWDLCNEYKSMVLLDAFIANELGFVNVTKTFATMHIESEGPDIECKRCKVEVS